MSLRKPRDHAAEYRQRKRRKTHCNNWLYCKRWRFKQK